MRAKRTKEKEVFRYFLLKLTNKEIAKLTDLSVRTIQRIIIDGKFKERLKPIPIAVKARELKDSGMTYVEVAKALKCSKTSVYNWLKQVSKE